MKGKYLAVGGSLFAIVAATSAAAQNAPLSPQPVQDSTKITPTDAVATPAPTAAGQEASVGDIIVTATKREESLNRVPLSITAASGEKLANLGVTNVADLQKLVPGFTYTESAFSTPVYTLRGVGFYDTSLGAKPAVSVYVDQVPLPFSIETVGATIDLERVEVLKGPQGTLFGSNSTGGAINYIAAKPTKDFHAGLDSSVSNFGEVDIGGFVSGPISDTLGARLAVRTEQGGDWQRSYTRNDKLGARNFTTGRFLLDFNPTNKLSFELNLNGYLNKNDGQAAQLIGVVPLGNPARAGALNAYPLAPQNDRDADWSIGQKPKNDNWFYQAALRGDWAIADALTLTSITSYSRYHNDQNIDPDGVALRDYYYNTTGKITAFNQEFRAAGSVGNLKYIIGGSYSRETAFQRDDSGPYTDATSAYQLVDAGLTTTPFFVYSQHTDQKFTNKAVFGNLDYDIGSLVTLHGGIRYTKSDIDFSGCTEDRGGALGGGIQNLLNAIRSQVGLAPITVAPNSCVTINAATLSTGLVTKTLNQDNISWRGGIDFKPMPGLLLYASASRGYKSGSFPTLSASDSNQFNPVTQESVIAYEIGGKWKVSPQLQLNGALFYYDYRNKQLKGRVVANPNIFGPLEALVNVPRSSIKGGEIQVDVSPTHGLVFSMGATYLDSKVKDNFSNYDSYGNVENFGGSPFPYTPKYQVDIDGQYDWDMGSVAPFIGGNLSFQSKTQAVLGDAMLTPSPSLTALGGLTIKSYELVDLRAGLNLDNKRYRVGLFVRNLFNEYYWTNATRITDTTVRFAGRPRTYGISLSARY